MMHTFSTQTCYYSKAMVIMDVFEMHNQGLCDSVKHFYSDQL